MSGRIRQSKIELVGVYKRGQSDTFPTPHWVKNEHAIWFDAKLGDWKIGRLDQIGSSTCHFYTTSGPPCPDSQSTEWMVDYNSEWIPAYGFINVTAQRNLESQIP